LNDWDVSAADLRKSNPTLPFVAIADARNPVVLPLAMESGSPDIDVIESER
jgi:hypothetical protein